MKTLAWLSAAGLLAAPVLAVAQGAPPEAVSTAPISDQGNAMGRAVAPAQMVLSSAAAGQGFSAASSTRNAPGAVPSSGTATPSASPPAPVRETIEDANSAPGRLKAGRSRDPSAPPGGGVIIDSKGRSLEVVPPGAPAQAPRAEKGLKDAIRSTEPAVTAIPGPVAAPLQPTDELAEEARQARRRRAERATALFGAFAVLAIFLGSRLKSWT